MKIVYITNASFLDHSYTIVKQLKKYNDVHVFLQAKEETGEIREWCSKLDAAFVIRKRYRNPLSIWDEFKFLYKVRKLRAEKIWFNGITVYQAVIARILLKNFLVMIHDVKSHLGSKDYFSMAAPKLNLMLFREKICAASFSQASLFEKKYGVSPDVFRLPVIDYYADIGVPARPDVRGDHKISFLFFGTIYPYKGIEILIEASEILRKKDLEFRLSVFGRLKYNRQLLKRKIDELEFVEFEDEYIDYKNVHKIFCMHDVLILPYREVTQCGPLLIGYNALLPSVCRELPGFREYVDDGESGLIFGSDAGGLAKKMEMLIREPGLILKMKEYIKTEIFNKYSIESLYNSYMDILKKY